MADGMKIPPEGVRAYPDIPFQEAFIAHRDGVETLIIQSSIDGEGAEFGWVVPVPAKPTNFEAVSPGVFDVLKQAVAPRVNVSNEGLGLLGGYVCFVLLFLGAHFLCPPKMRSSRPEVLVFLLGIIVLLVMVMGVSAGSARGIGVSGVVVEHEAQVGSYQVVVLSGENAAPLHHWLKENGFAELPPEAAPIVDDYLREGWVFVATKLRRATDSGEVLAPHPLRMDFPAEQAVYPMRLTALNADKMRLELFVAADGTPVAPREMSLEESSAFFGPIKNNERYWGSDAPPVFRARNGNTSIGWPEMLPLLWNGVQLTRLSGVFDREAMATDIELEIGPAKYVRKVYYSHEAARDRGIRFAVIAGSALFLVVAIVESRRRVRPRRAQVKVCLYGWIVAAALTFGVNYLSTDITDAEELPRSYHWLLREYFAVSQLAMFEAGVELTNENLAEQFQTVALPALKENSSDYSPMPPNDARPGGYVIVEENGETIVRFFDWDGSPIDLRASDFQL